MGSTEKILEINDKLMKHTESFKELGIWLAYLYPAIIRNSKIDIDETIDKDYATVYTFRKIFGENHFIWDHINLI